MLVGIDIVNVIRFAKLTKEDNFMQKYFTEYECKYIVSRPKPMETMAGIYASKEAFLKALGIGIGRGIDLKDIGVKHDDLGKPYYDMANEIFRDKISSYNVHSIDLSISHTDSVATAMCVVKKI